MEITFEQKFEKLKKSAVNKIKKKIIKSGLIATSYDENGIVMDDTTAFLIDLNSHVIMISKDGCFKGELVYFDDNSNVCSKLIDADTDKLFYLADRIDEVIANSTSYYNKNEKIENGK